MASKNDKDVKRPVAKRLFSLDNIKSGKSRRPSESSNHDSGDSTSWFRHGRAASKPSLGGVQESPKPDEFEEFLYRTGRATSPSRDPFASRPGTPNADPFAGGRSEHSTRSKTPEGNRPGTPTRRWDQLRHHVLPTPSRPSTPPGHIPRPPSAGPSRPGTPKPSRLAKLGFKQVVEHAREAESTLKFGQELARVCAAIRCPEGIKPKTEKDNQSTIVGGTTMTLPFMSNATLTSINQTGASKKSDAKRPQSALSFPGTSKNASLKALYQLLLYNSSASPDSAAAPFLPNEDQVLSALLVPFLVPNQSSRWEEERTIAVETIELLCRSWLSPDQAATIGRCVWCCRAAMIPASLTRTRILSMLGRVIVPPERHNAILTLHGFQTICHHLLMTLAFLHSPRSGPGHEGEIKLIKDLLEKFASGSYGDISESDIQQEYGAVCLPHDSKASLRSAVFQESLVRCLENCSQATRVWLLLNVVEDFWPSLPNSASYTALQMIINARKLNNFCKATSLLLQEQGLEPGEKLVVAQQIVMILQKRAIPETDLLDQTTALESRGHITQAVLELMCLDNALQVVKWAVDAVGRWLHDRDVQWKSNLDRGLERVISEFAWPSVTQLFARILDYLPDQDRRVLIATALPPLNERLVSDPPPLPYIELSNILNSISRLYPPIFFKPLFACAASNKELTVVNHLCTLIIYSSYVEDLWLRDAEMVSVALMSDVGAPKDLTSPLPSAGLAWSVARLGQSMLMVELIARLQAFRRGRDASVSTDPASLLAVGKFVVALEARLALLIEAKEQNMQIPPSQRMLLCMLFREIRLLTKSLKPATWLQRTIHWFSCFFDEDDWDLELEREVTDSMSLIHELFVAARNSALQGQTRRSTILLSTAQYERPKAGVASDILDLARVLEERRPVVEGLLKGFPSKAMKLFVAVSPLLHDDDYVALGPILWANCLDETVDSPSTGPASFLLMQCAERCTMSFMALIEVDLRSSDERTRLQAVRRIGVLVNWRFQLMSQNFVADRTHRPFKMARVPLPFVATDMGTSLYHPSEDSKELQDNEIPPELRKQLAELGWVDESGGPKDPHSEKRKTPMSLLPVTQLEKLDLSSLAMDTGVGSSVSPNPGQQPPSPGAPPRRGLKAQKDTDEGQPVLLRRASTSGGPQSTQKRRAIFVPPLTAIFIRLSRLMYDPSFVVAGTTRAILFDLMRNDPPLLTRPVMDLFVSEHKDVAAAVTAFSSYLHAHQTLPPPMSHNIFNNIMGFLKYSSRQLDVPETLHEYALVLPILASVITQVNGMTMREIRRSKTDPFVVPSGALWFTNSAPKGPMFPRGFEDFANPFEDITHRIISTTMVRISQNLLFLAMLKRNAQDVTLVRKNAGRLVLPSLSKETLEPQPLDLRDMLPDIRAPASLPEATIEGLSLIFARSHLLLVAQVFRSMSRHFSDRNELALWVDGIDKILCTHGHDVGIVGHALTALMVATTRFRRLFTAGTAYTLFMPALVKVYSETASHPGIRPAIEYALNRFYALHTESFLYQSLGIIGQMVSLPGVNGESMSQSIYSLFFSLTKGNSAFTVDAAGIHNINKSQEREALIVNTAEDKPQTFLANLRRTEALQATTQLSILFPEEYEAERLRMDNFVRLFLTVIAHDLTIIRAQHYLRLLRLLVPNLYHASNSTRTVLTDGIAALGPILLKGPKSKLLESTAARSSSDDSPLLPGASNTEHHSSEQSRTQSDLKAMRIDYLQLVGSFSSLGAHIPVKVARNTLDLFKMLMKDATYEMNYLLSQLLSDFVQGVFKEPPEPKYVVAFLQDVAPLLHGSSLDMTGVLNAIHRLTLLPIFAHDRAFSQVVVGEICTAALTGCELAASENSLANLPYLPALVKLMGESIFLEGADVVAEIEKRVPTYGFMAGVLLPLVVTLKTEAQINADGLRTQDRHRSVLASGWLRLLFYTIAACQGSVKPEGLQRSKSKDKTNRHKSSHVWTKLPVFVMALQILKIIVVRAEVDISSTIPGIWERIAVFLKVMISDGSADFAVQAEIPSAMNSPVGSPRTSMYLDPSASAGSYTTSPFPPLSSFQAQNFARPRAIDYMLWSTLEFIWAYRTPLRLQLRLLTTEKIVSLDADLRRVQPSISTGRLSILSSPRKRPISSMFSKVRRSGFATPDASPRASPRNSSALLEPSPAFLDVRRPGYQISPISPSDRRPIGNGPQIVHLGPASPSALEPPSPSAMPIGAGSKQNAIVSAKFKSLRLAEATYRRIRGMQALMGYDLLLPLPGYSEDLDETAAVLKTWTSSQALAAISQETKDLLEEFEQLQTSSVVAIDDDDIGITIEVQSDSASVHTLRP